MRGKLRPVSSDRVHDTQLRVLVYCCRPNNVVCVTYAVGEGREIYGMANYTPTNAPNMGDICMTTAPKGKLLSCASSETNSLSYTAEIY